MRARWKRHWQVVGAELQTVKVYKKFFGRLVASVGVLIKTLEDEGFKFCQDSQIQCPRRNKWLVKDGVDEARYQFFAKSTMASGHLIKHGANRVDVGTPVNALALELLGRHVRERPCGRMG